MVRAVDADTAPSSAAPPIPAHIKPPMLLCMGLKIRLDEDSLNFLTGAQVGILSKAGPEPDGKWRTAGDLDVPDDCYQIRKNNNVSAAADYIWMIGFRIFFRFAVAFED